MSKTAAILLCAGRAVRMGDDVDDKILLSIKNTPVFLFSVSSFQRSAVADLFVFVVRDAEQKEGMEIAIREFGVSIPQTVWVLGGERRQDSVLNALRALGSDVEYVFIHDCARPLVQREQLEELKSAVVQDRAACLAHRVVDTLKKLEIAKEGTRQCVLSEIDRQSVWAMETPQVFARDLITEAYEKVDEEEKVVTDDVSAANWLGVPVTFVENKQPNPKITVPGDLEFVHFLVQNLDK